MKRGLLVILLLCNLGAARGQSNDFLDIRGIVEAHLLFADSPLNWYRGGFGKLRYDDDTSPMQLGTAAVHTDLHFSDSL